jgi:hypothetical protein
MVLQSTKPRDSSVGMHHGLNWIMFQFRELCGSAKTVHQGFEVKLGAPE